MNETACYHCGRTLESDSDDCHTDEPTPGYWVEACPDCCTVCKAEEAR